MEKTSAQPAPLEEEELRQAEKKLEQITKAPSSPEEPMNFDAALQNIYSQSKEKEEELSEKLKAYEDWKNKMDALRQELGLPPQEETYPSQKSIDDVRAEIGRLKQEKEASEEGKEMNDILSQLGALSVSEINIIKATGKTSAGVEIMGKDGKKVKPGILEKLIELAKKGAKALTINGFKKLLDGVGGIGKAMFETEKK